MVIVVYDCSNRESFTSAARWLAGVRQMRPNQPVMGYIALLKNIGHSRS